MGSWSLLTNQERSGETMVTWAISINGKIGQYLLPIVHLVQKYHENLISRSNGEMTR